MTKLLPGRLDVYAVAGVRIAGAVDCSKALKHNFPDVYDRLKKLQADVLVTHEAPSAHPNGFKVLDELATKINIHTAFHGRHHDCFNYSPANELPRHLRNLNGNALRRMRQQRSIALNVKLRLKEGLHNPRRSGSRTSIIHTMKPGVRFDRFPGHIPPLFAAFSGRWQASASAMRRSTSGARGTAAWAHRSCAD